MTKTNVSSVGARILCVFKALRGHTLNEVSNGELAAALFTLLDFSVDRGSFIRLGKRPSRIKESRYVNQPRGEY
ncbi:hypothetical protein [Pectobacterium brasiliense]|uniref:hypothetical protein n=1 Tax=Pectobacterium brasiliense TaxID=180957 RepID=UPI003D9A0D86